MRQLYGFFSYQYYQKATKRTNLLMAIIFTQYLIIFRLKQ